MTFGRAEGLRISAALALLTGLFLLDTWTPLSFANHILYSGVVLVATTSRYAWMPAATAAGCTVLTVLGGFFSPRFPELPSWIPIGNRVFSIAIDWVLVWFAFKRRQAEAALVQANEALEEKVLDRTRELAGVNRALVSEITERMETEQALRLSQGRLAGILDMAEDAIIVTGEDRTIALFNQGAGKLFGYDAEEILGTSIDRLLAAGELAGERWSACGPAQNTGREVAQRREVIAVRKDGSRFPAEASLSKLTVGPHTTYTMILRDVTDRIRTERQLQSLTAQLMTAQEEERRRISRELHDDINQRLALLAIELGRLEAQPPSSPDLARGAFQSLTHRLAAISDDVRRMAYQFHPSILDDLGLFAALQYLADDFAAQTGIKTIVVQEEPTEPLPKDIASCLYRIAQESLANVRKHARAARVELELTCDGEEVTLSVRDGGIGFDLEQVRTTHIGLGLVNMRERVRSVQGRLDIQSQPGHGTQILVQIPLPGAPHESSTRAARR